MVSALAEVAGGGGHLLPVDRVPNWSWHMSLPARLTSESSSQYWQFSASTIPSKERAITAENKCVLVNNSWWETLLSTVFVYSWATVIQLELSRGRLSVVGRWSSWWHLSFSALMASHIPRLLLLPLQRLFRCATEREEKKKEDETLCSWRKTSSFFLSYRFAPHGWVDELGTKLTAYFYVEYFHTKSSGGKGNHRYCAT